MKRIEVICLKELSRESLMKAVPSREEKTILIKFEVPLIPGSQAEKSQYE